jgi:hypothetical protein
VSINRVRYYLHRLVFLFMEGELPEQLVDHIDGVRKNNRWVNLREVTITDSNRNLKRFSTNTSGVTGVSWHKKARKWAASIWISNESKHLGVFSEKEDAIKARYKAEVDFGYHENHGRANE